MGCAVSLGRSGDGEDIGDDVGVSVCRERKRLMKSAVDRRFALAAAHCKYNQSLYAVALAVRLIVARHSSAASSSSLLLTFPEPSPNPTAHPHPRSTESKPIPAANDVVGEEEEEEGSPGPICQHFYEDEVGPAVTSASSLSQPSQNGFGGWDFFNPFDSWMANDGGETKVTANGGGEGKAAVVDANVRRDAPPPDDGRELLEALKDVEDHFLKAYESGVEFSKMLEFHGGDHIHHDFSKSKETSEKLIPSIAWHKSSFTTSPSFRSLLSTSSRSSSTWTTTNDLFDDATGMESGSHSSTLGRLYAWEKKLYDEVKAGNEMRKIYEKKSSRLSDGNGGDKGGIEDEVNDLCSRLLVSLKISDSISKRIDKVRDEELQPQLVELLQGLSKTWKTASQSHKLQSRTMFEVKTFSYADHDPSRHLSTLQLEAEVQNWRTCFSGYVSATKAYVDALTEWAHRATTNESAVAADLPPVFATCRDWSIVTKNLPDESVTYAMKRFTRDIRTLWSQQALERQQKQRLDRLAAESKKRAVGLEREERKMLDSKSSRKDTEVDLRNKIEVLAAKKVRMDGFMTRLESERAKHKACVEETHRVMLVGFQTGFSSVFDSLAEFSEVCARKYDDVAENAKMASLGVAVIPASDTNVTGFEK